MTGQQQQPRAPPPSQTRVNGSSTLEMGNSNQELLSKGKKGKLTIILISLIIVAALVTLIFISLSGPTPEFTKDASPLTLPVKSIALDDFLLGKLTPNRFNGTWVSDNEILYRDSELNVILLNVAKRTRKVLLTSTAFPVLNNAFKFELSADKKYLFIAHSYQRLYRHSYVAYYEIFNLATKTSISISDTMGAPRQLQLVTWSPVGNALAYVYMNDIFYWPSVEMFMHEVRITRNGRTHTIHNGVPDWVYEEEVFGGNQAMWFSTDGKRLAFATFNDTTTPVMTIPYYGSPGNFAFQYTQSVNIRYPKPGRPNPEVSLQVADLESISMQIGTSQNIKMTSIPPPSELAHSEPILQNVVWSSDTDLASIWMNRVQNKAVFKLCSLTTDPCKNILSLEESSGWIQMADSKPLFSSDGKSMVFIYSSDQGDNAGAYRHLQLVDLTTTAAKPVPLTKGKFTVTELLAWDEANREVYFLSNLEGLPGQLRVSKVSDDPRNSPHKEICVSCKSLTHDGRKCLYSGASFSKGASYYTQTCAGPYIPEIRIFEKNGKEIMLWDENDVLRQMLSDVTLPTEKLLTVRLKDGFDAQVKLQFPPNMDMSGNTKYPLLIHVYGGPDSNLVNERFNLDWDTYLTVNKSIIYGSIDARMSGLKGDKMLYAGYRKLGTVEVEDQINVTKYLQNNFNFIDARNTAIWGWSYGGYVTVMTLATDKDDVFKCGIAVAPVTDWIYYDTIYTERYMGLPTVEDNLEGYANAALFGKVENLRHKSLFLVHGTLDDNVHYQQSMMLAKVLEENDILFRQQVS
ncbi:venom dipeptidyl peptidase 4 isoform X1 [Nilaparvata lugens]|uniref:venom dipeptidyl peptidase 4 isoform X1 n=1 Tax=Nilaparvata lugens TaxID=108931 RepID=UPI00193CE844|nr:venom dipeptidyl peptidase 4 isoform X1 [Nilaparvata lugens]